MKRTSLSVLILVLLLCAVSQGTFKFVAWADNRPYDSANEARFIWMLQQMNQTVASNPPLFHVVPGDYDYTSTTDADIASFSDIKTWYRAPGNHDIYDLDWPNSTLDLPEITPQARFIFLNEYKCPDDVAGCDCSSGRVCEHATAWIDSQCASANGSPIFVVGHEPAFPENRHVTDSLNLYLADRDAFWACLGQYGATYLCGHTHFYSTYSSGGATQIDLGNAGNPGESQQTFVVFTVDGSSVSSSTYTTEYNVDSYPAASNPQPADGATGLSVTPDLTWSAGTGAVEYKVYFGSVIDGLPALPNTTVPDNSCKVTSFYGTLAYETEYVWRVDVVYDAEHTIQGPVWTFTTKEELAVRFAVGETTVSGSVVGDIDGTERREDVYEQISEKLSNPGKNGYGALEHIWRIDNVPAGSNVQLRIEAYRTVSGTGDVFELSYSTNGSSYTSLGSVTKDSDDNSEDVKILPAGTNNTVWVKVNNTDHTKGSKICDTLYVDCLYIVSSDGTIPGEVVAPETGPGNQKPIANTGPDQTVIDNDDNGLESVTIDGSASYDPEGTSLQYEWAIDGVTVTGETGSSLIQDFPVGTYVVTLTVTDDEGATGTDDTIIEVVAAGGTMQVGSITGDKTVKGGSGQWTALVTLTILDGNDSPVYGATVTGQWTGDAGGTSSGVTGTNGQVTLSSGNIKKGTTATFTVTGIEHNTLTYIPPVPADQVTVNGP